MTPRQTEKIKNKITKIRQALSADKRRWGGVYDDSHGLRYVPPGLFLQLQDYNGAIKYFKWFDKNFPDDSCFPIFLFEWTVALFKSDDIKGAEKKALRTFFSNTYLFDKFLNKQFLRFDKYEGSNWEQSSLADSFEYSKDQTDLLDFADWISKFLTSDKFYNIANEFVDIERKLKTEPTGQTRNALVKRRYSLLDNYS